MAGLNRGASSWLIRAVTIGAVFGIVGHAGGRLEAQENKAWVAPVAARNIKNPVAATPESLQAADKLYMDNCMICHGEKGRGDGAFASTDPKPANFTDAKLIGPETDGSLFWKLSEGRFPMPSWKGSLSETERWDLVNYIRKLNKDANQKAFGGSRSVSGVAGDTSANMLATRRRVTLAVAEKKDDSPSSHTWGPYPFSDHSGVPRGVTEMQSETIQLANGIITVTGTSKYVGGDRPQDLQDNGTNTWSCSQNEIEAEDLNPESNDSFSPVMWQVHVKCADGKTLYLMFPRRDDFKSFAQGIGLRGR